MASVTSVTSGNCFQVYQGQNTTDATSAYSNKQIIYTVCTHDEMKILKRTRNYVTVQCPNCLYVWDAKNNLAK